MATNYTKPLKIGSQYIQSASDSDLMYVVGIVELYEAKGLSINPNYTFDNDTNTINYTYTYTKDNPKDGAIKGCYLLAVFLPEGAVITSGNPLKICVTNTKNGKDTRTGTVITNTPIVRPARKPQLSEDSTLPTVNDPRWLVLEYDVTNSGKKTKYYFIFVIATTNENNGSLLQLTYETKTLACGYIQVPESAFEPDPGAIESVAYISTEKNQFDTLTLVDQTANVSYTTPAPTTFNMS